MNKLVSLGYTRWVLAGAAAIYFVALFLPFAGGATGWQFLVISEAARGTEMKLTELLFTWASFLGIGVLTPIVIAMRRFSVATTAWMTVTVALILSVLAIWLRRTSSAFDAGWHHGPGIYIAILAVAVSVFAYAPVVLRRQEDESEVPSPVDPVALAQREAAISSGEDNPLLVDDRRARAAERHRRYE